MAGSVNLVTAGNGKVIIQPASSITSDVTLNIPTQNGTVVCSNATGNVGLGTDSPSVNANLSLGRKDSVSEGGQIDLFRSSDNTAAYSIDVYGSGTNPSLRVIDQMVGAERMRIDSSGVVKINTISSSYAGFLVALNSSATYPAASFVQSTAAGGDNVYFYAGTTKVGSITTTSSATAYNTSSDYRLKENIQPMQGALNVVAQLNPVTYTWKADGSHGQGFIAHELQAVVPDCVTGEKDAVDKEGKPVYQGIDTSFLVATLCKAIQELSAQQAALKDEVDYLKAKVTV